MASGGPLKELCEEVTCPVCLDYFQDPVRIEECRHGFCRGCLAQCWGEAEQVTCPLCKGTVQTRNPRRSRQLASFVEIAKKLSLQDRKGGEAKKEEVKEKICEKHQEPLNLFCQTDQVLVCVVCDRSKEHKTHEVILAGEAFEEYKDKIFRHLETLKTEREKIRAYLEDAENKSQDMLKITESERQKTMAEFRELHQLLNEQENRLLSRMEKVKKEIARKMDEQLARISKELSSLESLIQEMEEKHQQSVTELLLDVRRALQRCEKKEHFEKPVAFPSKLKWSLREYYAIGPSLERVRTQVKDALVSVPPPVKKAKVTLDPATTSLILSEDQRSINYQTNAQDVRLGKYVYGSVLGHEEFTGGCHFWDVHVGSEDGWAVGVARKPVRGNVNYTPKEGIWAVGKYNGQYKAFIDNVYPPLPVSGELKRIHVCLYCEGKGRVAFFDADAGTLLYAFSGVPFSRQTLYPFFAVYDKGHLRLSS